MTATDRVAVVTGGAQGIGFAIAHRLARSGQFEVVVVVDREGSPGDTSAAIQTDTCQAVFVRGDVSQEADVREAVSEAERYGRPTAVVNNAAVFPRRASLDMPFEEWLAVLRVNLGGTFLVSREFARGMLERGGGVIVNIASGRAFGGAVLGSHYASSKGGLISLTRSLALEWAPVIRVNAVVPGVTDTAQPRQTGISDEELYARGANIPLGRIGQPDDVAKVVEVLTGPAGEFVTGQAWCVNGGAIMR